MHDSSLLELRKFVSPEFVFGEGALSLAGRYAKNFGATNVLVVSDEGVIRAGWARKVIQSLKDEGLSYSVYSNVLPDPKSEEVMNGAEVYKQEGCDVIVAVGGGSPMDCAKVIGIVSTNRRNILEFVGVDQIPLPGPPLICVPTTCSSADVSQFAIITDTKEKLKKVIVSKTLVPDTSLIDPTTTLTMPEDLTAGSDIDAFVQAIEAFVSNASSPITDQLAMNALKLVIRHFVSVRNEPKNIEHRSKMMLGSLEAGLAFTNASLGLTHAMAHSLGGYTGVSHGRCISQIFPYVVQFNYDAVPERYDQIGELMGQNFRGLSHELKKTAIFNTIKKFLKEVGACQTLGSFGVKKDDLPRLARNAMNDVCIVTNPRRATLEDVMAIYEEVLLPDRKK